VLREGDYGTPTVEYYTVQNSFNQTFVNAVRATGGNNSNRFLVVQGFNTNIDHTVNFFVTPNDPAGSNKLFVEVHYYDPFNFTHWEYASNNVPEWPSTVETWANEPWVDSQFQKMKTNFIDRGIGVILGEYGVQRRFNVANHEESRIRWNRYITESAVAHGMVPQYWDNAHTGDTGFGLFNRSTGAEVYPDLIDAIVNSVP
jgi:endoglucanase